MSFGEPTDPYAPQGGQGPGHPQARPGYGYPQQGYGHPPLGAPQAHGGFVTLPGLGPVAIPSMGRRMAARVLDAVVYFVVFVIVAVAGGVSFFGSVKGTADACDSTSPTFQQCLDDHITGVLSGVLVAFALIWVITLAYEWLMVAFFGATLGKMALGMRIVTLETGARPGLGGGFIRWIVPNLGSVVCLIGQLIVYLSPFFYSDGKNRGWHDRAAGTIVIRPTR